MGNFHLRNHAVGLYGNVRNTHGPRVAGPRTELPKAGGGELSGVRRGGFEPQGAVRVGGRKVAIQRSGLARAPNGAARGRAPEGATRGRYSPDWSWGAS